MKISNKNLWVIIILILLLASSITASLCIGEINFSPFTLFKIISSGDGLEYTIIKNLRFPRILLGLAVGGSLSLSGVILQNIYRNPLVEPFTMGISGGAALGVAICIVSGLNTILGNAVLPAAGFAGAFSTVFLVYFLSIHRRKFSINQMLLIGVMISFIASSALMFLMSTTTGENLQSIIFWIMGSLDEDDISLINIILASSVSGLIISYLFSQQLNALRLGETKARHLGINTTIIIRILFVTTSLLTGICVAVSGVIGFVGLVIPHLLRLVVGSDNRILLICSFLGGSIFVVTCDIIARTVISPNELPIGVITGMVGGIVFLIVLNTLKTKNHTN